MIQFIYYILFIITLTYALYFGITGLFGFKNMNKKLIKKHKAKNKFAILIASRNEEEVVPSLIKSLLKQNYPSELFDVYVIPNNCTDNTEKVSLKAGAKIIKCTVPTKSKGEVLKFTFDKLSKEDIDAYVIFDADNVVHPDFLARMNDALCEGYKVAQGFRDSKNPGDNWISGSYSIFYWIQNFFFSKARMQMGGAASINGTGFMVKKEIIDEYGFNTVTLTEDVEFTAQCALNNIKVMFAEDAITYDEQPTKFKASWKQRKRWSMGNIQCFKTYYKKLFTTYRKTGYIACLDMLLSFMAPFIQILATILTVVLFVFKILNIQLYDVFSYMYAYGIIFFAASYIANIILNIFIVKYNKKSVKEILSGILLFTIFMLTWIPINFICIFKKDLTWEPIKHSRNVDIDEIKK
jgi:cellulose synthase/poly-beta-1,6-N-acetylglucosamine synthase-like glycosyltransferase